MTDEERWTNLWVRSCLAPWTTSDGARPSWKKCWDNWDNEQINPWFSSGKEKFLITFEKLVTNYERKRREQGTTGVSPG